MPGSTLPEFVAVPDPSDEVAGLEEAGTGGGGGAWGAAEEEWPGNCFLNDLGEGFP